VDTYDFKDLSVLVVDDSDTNRLILRETLQAAGAHVVESGDGSEAVAVYAERVEKHDPFKIVLCDVQMPGMDGFAVVDAIVALGGSVKTLMMLTSSNLNQDLERARTAGLGAYLVKPVKRAELLCAINDVLNFAVKNEDAFTSVDEPSAEQHSILLVEDNADTRLLIKAYLKREPYEIDEAENGVEALSMFKTRSYDVVLMDVQMPVMDGHAATREIRSYEAERGVTGTPIIALTAHAIKEDMDKSIAAGCSAHLTKPIKKQVLLAALQKYIGSTASM
jgi:CheY-like chemotaxis protein